MKPLTLLSSHSVASITAISAVILSLSSSPASAGGGGRLGEGPVNEGPAVSAPIKYTQIPEASCASRFEVRIGSFSAADYIPFVQVTEQIKALAKEAALELDLQTGSSQAILSLAGSEEVVETRGGRYHRHPVRFLRCDYTGNEGAIRTASVFYRLDTQIAENDQDFGLVKSDFIFSLSPRILAGLEDAFRQERVHHDSDFGDDTFVIAQKSQAIGATQTTYRAGQISGTVELGVSGKVGSPYPNNFVEVPVTFKSL